MTPALIPRPGGLPTPIAIAGAGRAGGALLAALTRRSLRPVRVWDRQKERGARLARRLEAELARNPEELVKGAKILILAVPDDALAACAAKLAAALTGSGGPAPVALHLAGASPAETIAPLREAGSSIGVFHPVVSLQGAESAATMPGSFATISGDRAAAAAARRLARALAMRPLPVDDARRPLLHLAAVFAAGDLLALLDEARGLLTRCGVGEEDGRELLASLARGAIEAFVRRGAGAAMTGPAVRGDTRTLASHLEALAASGERGGRADRLHRELSLSAAEIARRAGRLSEEQLRALRETLER
jgi:predicted short-subunit dehydrogenase-like oxidoreductase (DUF2520 family)